MLAFLFRQIFGESEELNAEKRALAAAEERVTFLEAKLTEQAAKLAEQALGLHRPGGEIFWSMCVTFAVVSLEAVLGGSPDSAAVAGPAWTAACTGLRMAWVSKVSTEDVEEAKHVHPEVAAVLQAALAHSQARLWHGAISADDEALEDKPDFSITHQRDAALSLLGSLVLVVLKKPGKMRQACEQCASHMSRRMFRLCSERDARGERLQGVTVYGVAMDGSALQLLRITTGAPSKERRFTGVIPCPVQCSPALTLLPWDWRQRAPPLSPPPPSPAFCALLAFFNVALAAGAAEAPLAAVTAELLWGEAGAEAEAEAEAEAKSASLTLALSMRLGSGGSSDVYAVAPEGSSMAAAGEGGVVLKLPRCATPVMRHAFERERTVLHRARAAAASMPAGASAQALLSLPSCLAHGTLAGMRGVVWPVLLLSPQGVPLQAWMATYGGSSSSSSSSPHPSAHRLQCATHVAQCCARALRAAHAAHFVHCDVRPSNVVMVHPHGGQATAVLVDWGSARAGAEDCAQASVPTFAYEGMYTQRSCSARAGVDAFALLLTWVCVAWHARCSEPWDCHPLTQFQCRREWLQEAAGRHQGLAVVVQALDSIESALRRSSAEDTMGLAEGALTQLEGLYGLLPSGAGV